MCEVTPSSVSLRIGTTSVSKRVDPTSHVYQITKTSPQRLTLPNHEYKKTFPPNIVLSNVIVKYEYPFFEDCVCKLQRRKDFSIRSPEIRCSKWEKIFKITFNSIGLIRGKEVIQLPSSRNSIPDWPVRSHQVQRCNVSHYSYEHWATKIRESKSLIIFFFWFISENHNSSKTETQKKTFIVCLSFSSPYTHYRSPGPSYNSPYVFTSLA